MKRLMMSVRGKSREGGGERQEEKQRDRHRCRQRGRIRCRQTEREVME